MVAVRVCCRSEEGLKLVRREAIAFRTKYLVDYAACVSGTEGKKLSF